MTVLKVMNSLSLEGPHEVLGASFNGTAVSVPADGVVEFYEKNEPRFNSFGTAAYLRNMGIPASFFQKQEKPLKSSILTAQKDKIRSTSKGLYVLVDPDGKVCFAAKQTPLGWKHPNEVLGIDTAAYGLRRDDKCRGKLLLHSPLSKDESMKGVYQPCLFLNIPVFYADHIYASVALVRLICTNGLIDSKNQTSLRFEQQHVTGGFFRPLLTALEKKVGEMGAPYATFFSKLAELTVTPQEALIQIRSIKMPKTLADRAARHVDLVVAGKDVEANSPRTINNQRDVLDLCTFYAQSLGSASSQLSAERNIFGHFQALPHMASYRVKDHGVMLPQETKAPATKAAELN